MIRAILWKEWREHRGTYVSFWVMFHAPIMFLAIAIGLTSIARLPFADLSDAMVMKYLPLALIEPLFTVTLLLLVTGYLAVATFSKESDDHSLFFIFEQPIARRQYVLIKLLNGACHVVLATCCAILLMPVAAYIMMLMSGKVTIAGSGAAFWMVMAAALRCAVWCSLITLAGFTISVLISALVPGWWVAAVCSLLLTVYLIGLGGDFFSFYPEQTGDPISLGVSAGTGNTQWITISRALTSDELRSIANFRWLPVLTAVLIAAVCTTATLALYERKQLK